MTRRNDKRNNRRNRQRNNGNEEASKFASMMMGAIMGKAFEEVFGKKDDGDSSDIYFIEGWLIHLGEGDRLGSFQELLSVEVVERFAES